MYKVILRFADLQDMNHIYEVGDTYPRKGSDPTKERIQELASDANKIGKVLIEKVKEEKPKAEKAEIVEAKEKAEPIKEEKPKPRKRKKVNVE